MSPRAPASSAARQRRPARRRAPAEPVAGAAGAVHRRARSPGRAGPRAAGHQGDRSRTSSPSCSSAARPSSSASPSRPCARASRPRWWTSTAPGCQVVGVDLTAPEPAAGRGRSTSTATCCTASERAAAVDAGSGRGVDLADVLALVSDGRSALATAARARHRQSAPRASSGPTARPHRSQPRLDRRRPARAARRGDGRARARRATTPTPRCTPSDTLGAGGDDLILVQVGRGVGCGLVVDGRRVRGAHFAAGEIGHVTVGTDGGETCGCGQRRLPRDLAVRAAAAAGDRRRGATAADGALRSAGERLAIALAPVVAALDLSEVVLAGPAELLDAARSPPSDEPRRPAAAELDTPPRRCASPRPRRTSSCAALRCWSSGTVGVV